MKEEGEGGREEGEGGERGRTMSCLFQSQSLVELS